MHAYTTSFIPVVTPIVTPAVARVVACVVASEIARLRVAAVVVITCRMSV